MLPLNYGDFNVVLCLKPMNNLDSGKQKCIPTNSHIIISIMMII